MRGVRNGASRIFFFRHGADDRRMKRPLAVALIAVTAWSAPAMATPQVRAFYGYAYEMKSDRFLYTEVHHQTVDDGHWLGGTIRYYAPDGHLIGEKTLDFHADPYVPIYRFDMAGDGYYEAITAVGTQIAMEKRSRAGDALQKKALAHVAPMCADSGFHPFLVDHFDKLLSGETLSFTLGVAGNLDAYRFRARRIADGRFENRSVVRFRVEPDSVLRWFVDPLEVSYDPQTRRLLEYRGIANVPDPRNGKPWIARIAYYSRPPKDVPVLPPLEP